MVSGSAAWGGAAGCGTAWAASRPAKNPASHARWVALAGPTTRLRSSISSSAKGAVLGIGESDMGNAQNGWGGSDESGRDNPLYEMMFSQNAMMGEEKEIPSKISSLNER